MTLQRYNVCPIPRTCFCCSAENMFMAIPQRTCFCLITINDVYDKKPNNIESGRALTRVFMTGVAHHTSNHGVITLTLAV